MMKSIAALLSVVGANAQLSIPDAPTSVALDVLSGSQVRVSFESPLSDGGSAVQSYSVEWDTDPGVQEVQAISTSTYTDANEIQVITTTAADQNEIQLLTTNATVVYEVQTITTDCNSLGTLGGTFSVGLDTTSSGGSSEMSGEISYNADAEGGYLSVKRILESMQNIGENGIIGVDRVETDASKGAYKWTITFATTLGDIPQLTRRDSALTGSGASVSFETTRDQNLLGGSFRLSYQGYTTASIPHDATGGEVATALESLSTIDTVNVKRVGPTDQGGYNWTVTFTSDYNGANIPELIPTYDDLSGIGSSAMVTTVQDGNELGGFFNVSYNTSTAAVPFDATPSAMKAAIESVGFGEVVVHRSGPDFELGYSWTVSFIEFEGDLDLIELDITKLTGDEAYAETVEARQGTIKEVQTISTFGGRDDSVNSSTKFFLKFRGEMTGVIEANPNQTAYSCDATAREVQQIKTSTVDTFGAGGDDHVSSSLYFSLTFYTQDGDAQETGVIYANPEGGDCEVVANSMETELESLENLEEVTVTWSDMVDDESCTWRVTFDDQSGNLEPMALKVQGGANTGAAANGFWGDDSISLTTIRDGTVDAIKYELEQLTTIGTVTVDPGVSNASFTGGCSWRVTFETNTGKLTDGGALTPLTVASVVANGSAGVFGQTATAWPDATDSISICADASQCVNGTSVQLGGQFTVSFRGYRTLYMDHDISARGMKQALEALPTVERVDVSRVGPDENEGFTWAVTFLTELGDVPPLYVDTQALTGTAPWSRTYERDSGVFPPFDSLDPENGLPLGSTAITSLDDLSITIPLLEQGIPYYFRVSALNANGQGPASLASPAFAVPLPQSASSPTGVSLSVVDGGALSVATMAPERDGGEEIDRYRVQYATQQFAQEVQAVRLTCDVDPEIQVVETSASDIDEVQIIHAKLDDDYEGETLSEVQQVWCDAAYGSFTLTIFDETTADINVDDSASEIQARLQELSRLNNVNVTFPDGVYTACQDCGSAGCGQYFNVTFLDVEGAAGDMPLMVPNVHGLYVSGSSGNRRVSVNEAVQGQAGLSGSFKLTFRGYTTVDISHNATSQEVLHALRQLDPIPYHDGVSVSRVANVGYERMWRVTFSASEVGGNVESMNCFDHDMRLYGNGAQLSIYSDGSESSYQRRDTNASIAGNELGGSFTLTMLGHTTEPIDFNAADTQMKARLEALPNLGVVDVTRGSPSPEKGYAWTITYVSNPGAFPVAASDMEYLTYDLTDLSGEDVTANVTTSRKGYHPLGGTFQLRYTNGSVYRTTSELAHNSDSSEVQAALEALDDIVGRVSVEKTVNVDGYTWSVTFGPCQTNPVTGEDVCNDGDLYLLELVSNSTLEGCASATVGVTEVVKGSGPDLCPLRDSGYCYDDITDLSNGAPFAYEISMLDVGTPYYVRVSAHTDESFGTYAVSYPEFAVPSHLQPGAPPRVRLVRSTETTITVEWDHPTENGGSPVRGYELWMDDWEGGNLIKVYDGTADSDTLSFTVDPDNAPHLESGRKYQFIVRAINLCRATDDDLACYSDFSNPAVFTVRAARPPLAPAQPLRDSAGTSTGARGVWGDGSITVNWMRPVDNGGGNITHYRLFMEAPDGNVSQVLVKPEDVTAIDQSMTYTDIIGDQLHYRYTMDSLDEGEVYLFQVAAVNARGRSGLSSPVAVVCAERPGGTVSQNISSGNTTAFRYGLVKPTVVDVSATSIGIEWDEPLDRGVSPITGYEVWMYPGAPLNTQADPEPVKQEIQVIRTVVDTPATEVQVLTITDARNGGQFRLRIRADSAVGGFVDSTTDLITLGRCNSTCLASAIVDVAGDVIGNVSVSGPVVVNSSQAYTISFEDYVGPLTAIALESHDLEDRSAYATWYSSVVRSTKGTEPVRGTFTVKFRGFETPALPYDISGAELERELNNLESSDIVSVTRSMSYNEGYGGGRGEDSSLKDNFGAYEWTITFVNVMGDVPLLYPSPGRLTCSAETAECVGIEAETIQPGTDAVLVYDGSHAPHVRKFTATGLVTDALYSFKVVPINAVGRGLPSAATATVSARIGASASQTTVRGGAVSVGMAGVVHETQVITAYDTDGHFSVTLGSWFGESLPLNALLTSNPGWDFSSTRNLLNDPNDDNVVSSAEAVKAALEAPHTGIHNVHVTRSAAAAHAGMSGVSWTVTFLDPVGNIPTLRVNSTNTSTGSVRVAELLSGASNEFTIEPKKASGAPVKDITARSNFGAFDPVDKSGGDVFFTELWTSPIGATDGTHSWDSDGGVASYSPVLYEIQRLYIPGGTTGGFRLKFDQTSNFPSKKDEVCDYISGDFGVGMKEAPSSYDGTTYLGGGDEGSFGYECLGHHTGGWGAPRLGGESYTTANITVNSSALAVKLALEELPNIEAVDVTYEVNPFDNSMTYLVTFTHDLGDLPLLQYVEPEGTATASGEPLSRYMNISEIQEGITEVQTVTTDADIGFVREIQTLRVGVTSGRVGGFFNVTLPGADKWVKVAYDAEATAADSLGNGTSVQELLQSLSNIGRVGVSRKVVKAYSNDTSSSHYQWSVTFYDPVGDVPDLVVQTNGLTGRKPYVDVNEVTKGVSPLGGTFVLSYGSDFTDDIDFDASNETVKAALEALPSIDEVNVRRMDLGSGHRWEVTFTKAVGNLPEMVAHMHRYEIQYIRTLGGDPTPLGGSFAMRYGGASTQQLPYDASAAAVKLALESLPTVDRVDVARDVYDFGSYQWRVTFRSEIGNIPMMVIDTRLLTGSDARGTVAEHVAGDGASLTGSTPFVRVAEKTAGLPSYTAMYSPNATGAYTLAVRQLTKGGLSAAYFDNQWLLGSPSLERIDPALNFDWGTGAITKFGRDFVSARWHGKLVAPTSELYTLYLSADDGARLWIDHELIIDTWESNSFVTGAARAFVNLTADHFHDIRVEYKEEVGKASLKLEWQSLSIFRQTIPSSAFYYATQVSGSPYALTVMPGASDYPYTSATGEGLSEAISGEIAHFIIQTRDENGNARTDDEAAVDTDFLNISIFRHNRQLGQRAYLDEAGLSGSHVNGHLTGFYGSTDHAPSTMGKPEYIGDGQYKVSYTILKSGYYKLHITSGGSDIECGRGSAYACSPFTLFVDPGPTVAVTTEAEGALSPLMDGLTEAAAGDMGYFFIQAKDTYGNNRIIGGDNMKVMLTFDADPFGKSSAMISRNPIQYRGHVVDHTNGTYLVTYTVPRAGTYKVHLTVNDGQRLNSCTPPVNRPEFLTRQYTGLRVYHAPETCAVEATTLLVVHGPLQASATTAVETSTEGLTRAVVGVENTFTIQSRDEFGNLRRGDGTNHFGGYGDGKTDPFSIDFVGPHGYTYKTSSAVMTLSCNDSSAEGFFRMEFDGMKSLDLSLNTSASALEAAIYNMHPGDPHRVRVSRANTGGINGDRTFYWRVTFISHLDAWAEEPLSIVIPSYSTDNDMEPASLDAYRTLSATIDASRGLYPCAYVLWYKGSYFMSVKHFNGEHIEGSPFSIEVDDGETEAASSYVVGDGLVGGVAGEQLTFTLQARDVRQREVQAISINATIVPVIPERQTLVFNVGGSSVSLTFRGETTTQIAVDSTWAQVEAALEALTTIDDVELNSSYTKFTAASEVDVLFVGPQVRGDVPPIKSSSGYVTSSEDRKGDAPFVNEVQTLTCKVGTGLSGENEYGTFNVYAPLASGVGSGGFRGLSGGNYLTVDANQTVADFEAFFSAGLETDVTVRVSGVATYEAGLALPICSKAGTKLLLEFTEARGDLPALRFNSSGIGSNGTLTLEHGGHGGSVDGVHPVWGSFTLSFKGAETRPLPFDATPIELEQALERLPSIGGVTVEHWTPGRRVDKRGADFSANTTGLTDMWIVRFDGTCSNATEDWAQCPEHIGDEPMMVGNASGLNYQKSSHVLQAKPQLVIVETTPGSAGNNRGYGDDGQNIEDEANDFVKIGVKLVHETRVATPSSGEYQGGKLDLPVGIGNYEIQALECASHGLLGTFELYFLGDVIELDANMTLAQVQSKMHDAVYALNRAAGRFLHPPAGGHSADYGFNESWSAALTVTAADGVQNTICAHDDPSPILFNFIGLAVNRVNPYETTAFGALEKDGDVSLNYGTLPEINATSTEYCEVKTYEVVKGLDSMSYLGDGLYEMKYTPTVKGRYEMVVTIDGVEVSTDLIQGVFVTPAPASASTIEHFSDSVAVEGITETFLIQSRDRFDNDLDSLARGLYTITLEGEAGSRSSGFMSSGEINFGALSGHGHDDIIHDEHWGQDGLNGHVLERPNIKPRQPNSDGIYEVDWMPRVAGSYVFSANYTDYGGLLATYFRMPDLINGAVRSDAAGVEFSYPYHTPPHCPRTQLDAEFGYCDSTRLDPVVSFDWGQEAPLLVLDHDAHGRGHYDGRDGRTTHPYGANFPTDYWSANWEGFVAPPSSSVAFKLVADDDSDASISVNGVTICSISSTDEETPGMCVGNWSKSSAVSRRMVNGIELYDIFVTYSERSGDAKLQLLWSLDGSDYVVIPSKSLYYTRHIERSPYRFLVYPGEVEPRTSSAFGGGLADCTTMSTCGFTIQARDTQANQRFNRGDNNWLLTMTGVEDWAAQGRVDDIVYLYTDDKQYYAEERRWRGVNTVATTYEPSQGPNDWQLLGNVTAVEGLRYLNVSQATNLTNLVTRGATVIVGNETLVVSSDQSERFDANIIPISDPFRQPTGSYELWLGGELTGTYEVRYHPTVRGEYRLDVQLPAIPEIQVVETFVDPGSPLGGNFTLKFDAIDKLSGLQDSEETGPIPFNATDDQVEDALSELSNVDMVSVSKENCANPAKKCKWAITFNRIRFQAGLDEEIDEESYLSGEPFFPTLRPNIFGLKGNNASVAVTVTKQGRPPQHIHGSPFFVHVATNITDPASSTAYGKGLYEGIAGEISTFRTQSKDRKGNDRTDDQEHDSWMVVPFIPLAPYDEFEASQPPHVDPNNAKSGGSIEEGGSAKYVEGGAYEFEFTPTRSGDYTVAVLAATDREHQRITTSFFSEKPSQREGSFKLRLRQTGEGFMNGNGNADSLHIPETALYESKSLSWDADANAMKEAIEEMGGVGGEVFVTRSELFHNQESSQYEYAIREDPFEAFGRGSNFGYTYDIYFNNYVGDLPSLVPIFADTLVGGIVNISEVQAGNCEHIMTKYDPLVYETQVVFLSGETDVDGTFSISFRGHSTDDLPWDASADHVKSSLEALLPVGSVSVVRNSTSSGLQSNSSWFGFEWAITFMPEDKCDRRHALNYGNLPAFTVSSMLENANVTVYEGGEVSPNGVTTMDGSSPWSTSAKILAAAVSPIHSTAVDSPGSFGLQGLRSGTYNSTSSFIIESRDRFKNRVLVGPLKEVQIVSTMCGMPCNLVGTWTLGFRGHSVELEAGVGIAALESALESLDTIGAVTVTTYGVHDLVGTGTTVQVVMTDPDIYPSGDLSSYLAVGDWIRLDSNDGFVYSIVSIKATSPYVIRLNKPYEGLSNDAAPIYRQDKKGNVGGYQYIITFDSNTGDLPSLVVNGSSLIAGDGGNKTAAEVTACDWYQRQTISTYADSKLNGTFYLEYAGERTRDLPFFANSSEIQHELNSLDTIYRCSVEPASVGQFGERRWTVNLGSVSTDDFEPIFAEGHLLRGSNARIEIEHDCSTNGRGKFPHNCNATRSDGTGGSFRVHGCQVQAVAGRLGSEYRVALSGSSYVAGNADHVGKGLYKGSFMSPRVGTYDLAVSEAACCGLSASLFNNRWLLGEPVLSRVDPRVDFVWSAADLISPTGKDYVSIRWVGFIRPAFSEELDLILEINDGVRLFLDGMLLIDAFEDRVDEDESASSDDTDMPAFSTYQASSATSLVADQLYEVKIEFRESTGGAVARMLWQSASQPLEVVPSHRLFYSSSHIKDSPFSISPIPIEPLPVVDVGLEVVAWDTLDVTWHSPWNDGGSEVDGFLVEWWSAIEGEYGDKEEQTIKIADTVDGGDWKLGSPGGGAVFHSPLDWNVSSDILEAALETFSDVGDVTVEYSVDAAKGTRNYHIVFETDLGNISSLLIDGRGLTASDGSGVTTAVVCAHGMTSTLCAHNDSIAGTAAILGSTTDIDMDIEDGTYEYRIAGLLQTSDYDDGFSVRVTAHTPAGYGIASPPETLKPVAVPDPPGSAEMFIVPGSDASLRVHWTESSTDPSFASGLEFGDRCAEVDAYLVEWDISPQFNSYSTSSTNPNKMISNAYGSILRQPSYFSSDRIANATDAEWFSYVIPNLEAGVPIYTRVTSRNRVGLGNARYANEKASLIPRTAPQQIEFGSGVVLSTVPAGGNSGSGHGAGVTVGESTSSLLVQFVPTPDERGAKVLDYLVEWWRSDDDGQREVQVLQTSASATLLGTFTLSYDGEQTDSLSYDIEEEALELALEGLATIRDVEVTRSSNQTFGYQWSVTFMSEEPFVDNLHLIVDGSGLSTVNSSNASSVSALVGRNLRSGLPGWHGDATLDVVQGSDRVTVSGASVGPSTLQVGDYVRIVESSGTTHIHQVKSKSANSVTWILSTPYTGSTATNIANCDYGVTVPGRRPRGLTSAEVASFDTDRVGRASYTITGLNVDVAYSVRVSSRNARGYSAPQSSNPLSLSPPLQKPGRPNDVKLVGDSDRSLRVLFNAPDDDGGVTITKYKIEWDVSPSFSSGVGAGVLGSHHMVLASPVGACALTPCEYTMSGLTKGTGYYVRVFSYNKFGFSEDPTISYPASETPCTYAKPPSQVTVNPTIVDGQDGLKVSFLPSADDGGCAVTRYKVEWDPAGALGYQHGAESSTSLLYASNEVQVITMSSTKNDLSGSFRVALDDMFASDPIKVGCSAAELADALNELATVGGIKASRTHLANAGEYGWTYTVTFKGHGGGRRWVGDVAPLRVSTNTSDYPSEFTQNAQSGSLIGSGPPSITTQTAVDGARGFEQQEVKLWASAGGIRGTFRVGWSGSNEFTGANQATSAIYSAPLAWNASAQEITNALNSVGVGAVRVARELDNSASEITYARSREQVTAGLGEWDGKDTGIRYVVVFEGATKSGGLPLISLDASSLRSTNYTAVIKHNVSTLVVGETPTLNSALKGQAILAVGSTVGVAYDAPNNFYDESKSDLDDGLITEPATTSGGSFVKTITDLVSGEAYHVRVSAWNGFGNSYGDPAYATPTAKHGLEKYGVR